MEPRLWRWQCRQRIICICRSSVA